MSVRAGVPSVRGREALERALVEGDGASGSWGREDVEALEQRMGEFKTDLRRAVESVRGDAVKKGAPGRCGRSSGSLHMCKTGGVRSDMEVPVGRRRRAAWTENRREYPEPLTCEPAQDDGEFYGDAWPLVNDWRTLELRRVVGTKLNRARTRERIMELELAMIDEQGLTLPPANSPMHPSEKRIHLGWRMKTLGDLRRERRRLEFLGRVQRVLTLGLWRT